MEVVELVQIGMSNWGVGIVVWVVLYAITYAGVFRYKTDEISALKKRYDGLEAISREVKAESSDLKSRIGTLEAERGLLLDIMKDKDPATQQFRQTLLSDHAIIKELGLLAPQLVETMLRISEYLEMKTSKKR